MLYRKTIAFFI